MIFGVIELEGRVQVNDKTRLDCVKSYKTPDEAAITLVRIKPSGADSFITVSSSTDASIYYLDWSYASAGTKTVTLEITNGGSPVTFTKDIVVVTAATDNLFSSDADLISDEPDILKWVPKGRSSYLNVHRSAQTKIMNEIYKNRILDNEGEKFGVADIIDIAEVGQWSKYLVLQMIFEGRSNAVDDIFALKANKYKSEAKKMMDLSFNIIRLDFNKNATLDDSESVDLRSGGLIRR